MKSGPIILFSFLAALECGARLKRGPPKPLETSDDSSLKTAKEIKKEWAKHPPNFEYPKVDIDALVPKTKTDLSRVEHTSNSTVTKIKVQYIKTPVVQQLASMRADTDGMLKGNLPVPGTEGETKVDVYCYPPTKDQHVSGSILNYGTWECEWVAACAKPWLANANLKGNFLDLGGNIGAYTLPMGRFLQGKGEVISVEGMPDIAEHLKAGVIGNKLSNVNLFQYCVGAEDAADSLTMNRNPYNKGGSTIDGNKNATATWEGKKIVANLTTLDAMLEVLPALQSVVSMKSDIEGNEGRMLKGAHTFFSKYPPCYLQFELHPDWLDSAGTPYNEVVQMLTTYGYKMVSQISGVDYQFEQKDMASCLKRFV